MAGAYEIGNIHFVQCDPRNPSKRDFLIPKNMVQELWAKT